MSKIGILRVPMVLTGWFVIPAGNTEFLGSSSSSGNNASVFIKFKSEPGSTRNSALGLRNLVEYNLTIGESFDSLPVRRTL